MTDTSNAVSEAASDGYSATGETTVHSGVGVRGGVTFPVGNGCFLGGSLGIIGGLDAKQTINATSDSLGNVSLTSETKVSFLRFLVEGVKKLPVSDSWGFNLGAGLGLANGHAKIDSSGSATGFVSSIPKAKRKPGPNLDSPGKFRPAIYFARRQHRIQHRPPLRAISETGRKRRQREDPVEHRRRLRGADVLRRDAAVSIVKKITNPLQ